VRISLLYCVKLKGIRWSRRHFWRKARLAESFGTYLRR
jgi:hypothetical protein